MWTCPKCKTKVDPSLDVCWSCGTTQDGVEDPTFVAADEPPPRVSPLDLDMPKGDEPVPQASSALSGGLVECYWAMDLMQAKFLADRLSDEGIPAVADMHDMHDALGSMSSGPRVWVRAEDLARARAWLKAYDEQYRTQHGGVDSTKRKATVGGSAKLPVSSPEGVVGSIEHARVRTCPR